MKSDKTKVDPGVLLNFLQEQHGNLGYYEHRKKKWLVCTSTHETWGISAIDALHNSMEEHKRDGCLYRHILKNSVKKLNSEMEEHKKQQKVTNE